jgi:DNA polymerase-1
LLEGWLRNPDVHLIGHNTAYDTVVCANERPELLPLLFNAYEAGRIHCTMLREMLIDLSHGKLGYRPKGYYTLGNLAKKYLGVDLSKDEDSWRYRYGQLIHVPIRDWPHDAKKYALDDGGTPLRIYELQGDIPDSTRQAAYGFAFQLMQTWGMRTDPEWVEALERRLDMTYSELQRELRQFGLIRADGSQDKKLTQSLIEATYPGPAPRTKPSKSFPLGQVKTSSEVCEKCSHPGLQKLSDYSDVQKLLTTFVPVVKQGTVVPVCPSINTLVKNGRSSYRKPNLQNLPRKGGVRECFVPRSGKVFIDADYDSLEVRTLGQVLWSHGIGRTLVDRYNADPDYDPHSEFGGRVLNLDYETAIQWKKANHNNFKTETRQMCKAGVFGLPGGMGAKTFVDYAWNNYKVRLTLEKSRWLSREYRKFLPEINPYFDLCKQATQNHYAVISQLFSGRIRGGMTFTDLANGWWSGLAADATKWGLFNVSKACYALPESPLYGSRLVVYVHDEYMLEADAEGRHEIAKELERVAIEHAQQLTPNVPLRMEACAMDRWWKQAEPVYDQHGRLDIWRPS